MGIDLDLLLLSTDQLEAKARLLAPNYAIDVSLGLSGFWVGSVRSGEESVFDTIGLDRRVVFLDIVGWLQTQKESAATAGDWGNKPRSVERFRQAFVRRSGV